MKDIRLVIENKREDRLLVFVEPEAFDFWLQPGEVCELVASRKANEAHFELQQTEDGITVFPSRGCGSISVTKLGVELPCGHQRPDGWK